MNYRTATGITASLSLQLPRRGKAMTLWRAAEISRLWAAMVRLANRIVRDPARSVDQSGGRFGTLVLGTW
jgi:hypothetical protein